MADEFTTMLEALWSSTDNVTLEGRYWNLVDAFVTPKPLQERPLLVNATGSPAGINYASRHSDLVFITSPAGGHIERALAALPGHTAEIKARAREGGRIVKTIINPMIICRSTEAEARQYYAAIVARADPGAIEGFLGRRASGDARGWSTDVGAYRAVGGNIQIIGSPTQVASKLIELKKAGCDGVQLTFFDFAPDLEFFGHNVLPLLQEAGLHRGKTNSLEI
jgi:FMNH2-dependent dimethyl sulfone monooxygenase